MFEEELENLNSEQKKAVLQTEGPVLILAGAGSGKTRVITFRIAYLILKKNISPYNICAVTFTNKAAAEMKERITMILPNSHYGITVKTFHSLCLQILRSNSEILELSSNFTVYDTSLQESLIKDIVKKKDLDSKSYSASNLANKFNKYKDQFLPLDEFGLDNRQDQFTKNLKDIFFEYEKRKKENHALDFGDLIYKVVGLFTKHPEVLQKYNSYWKYILVDEYQDTNKIQYLLSKMLAGKTENLCVVGDDDQSIYSWRGADIRNILDFEKDYKKTFTVKLEENYRSTKTIIEAASNLIQNNSERKDKKIFSNKESGEKIRLNEFYSENEESNFIINEIIKLNKEIKNLKSFAIFYRTNAQSRYFEESLRSKNLAYKIFGGFRFFDRAEIKDLVSYLTVLVNPNDNLSLERIINFPPRGIGDASLDKIRNYAIDNGLTLFEVLNENPSGIKPNMIIKLKDFYSKLKDLRNKYLNKTSPSLILRDLLEMMGIIKHFKEDDSLEGNDRLENIEQFLNALEEYEEETENPDLGEYLGNISLLTSEENPNESNDFITLMTVHNSKGLEFDYVFLTGLEDGTFPHSMSLDSEKQIEEERRLCYVAITRAKKKLYMSFSKITRKFGLGESRIPSRFFDEIPEHLLEKEDNETDYRKPTRTPFAGNRLQNNTLDSKKRSVEINSDELKIGDKVKHKDFGFGKIIDITGSGDNRMARVSFGFNQKKFLLAYTKFEKIN